MKGIIVLTVCLVAVPVSADVWVEKPTTKVLKDFTPEGKANVIFVEAARNEYEGVQIVLKAGDSKIEQVTLELTPLTGPSAKVISPEHAQAYLEYFHTIEIPSPCDAFMSQDCGGHAQYKRNPGDYPDALIPLVDPYVEEGQGKTLKFDVAPNDLQVVWLEFYVPQGMPAGGYWGHLRIRAKGTLIANLPVTLTVWDIDIPTKRSMATAFGFGGGHISKYHGGPEGGDAETQARLARNYEWEVHRHRMDYTTHNPGLSFAFDEEDNLSPIDFAAYEAYMGPRLDGSFYPDGAGINRYNVGMFRPGHGMMGMTETQYAQAAAAVAEHLDTLGYLDHAYLYSLDEPWLLDHWRNGSYEKIQHDHEWLLKETALWDGHVMITGPWQQQLDGIGDIWCPVTPMFGDLFWPPDSWPGPEKYSELVAGGDELWFYNCNANFPPQPGYDIDTRVGFEPRILKWGSWFEGATGFLHWRLNYWFTTDPWHDLANYAQFGELFSRNGDGLLLYPGDHNGTAAGAGSPEWVALDGPIISYRMKQIRDGLEDWELFILAVDLGLEDYTRQQVSTAYRAFGAYFDDDFDIADPPWTLDEAVLLGARRNIALKVQHVLHPEKYPDPEQNYEPDPGPESGEPAMEPAPDVQSSADHGLEVVEATPVDLLASPDSGTATKPEGKASSGCSSAGSDGMVLWLLASLLALLCCARLFRMRKEAAGLALVVCLLSGPAWSAGGLQRQGSTLVFNGQPITLVAYGCYGILTESDFDYDGYFDVLQSYGINFVRIWGNYHWTNDLVPFVGTRNNADLAQLSDAYFNRLQALVSTASAHGIVVMFTFFDSVCLEGPSDSGNRWINCPYRKANNQQPYCDNPQQFDDVPPDQSPPIWTVSHAPYMNRVVQTLGAFPNVIYEIMNEPYSGYGDQAFHNHAIDYLHSLLNQPGLVGSKLIATNDDSLSNVSNSKVDVVSYHVHSPSGADDYNGLGKPVIISNDGDTSQSSTTMDNQQRITRIGKYAKNALSSGAAAGHNHLEILDKDIDGATWGSQDYDPKISNLTHGILAVLAPYADGLAPVDCQEYDHIIDDQDGGPQFTLTGDDWATWGTNGCGFDNSDSSYHYLSKTVGGPDKKGTATWTPDLPVAGTYEIFTWYRKTGNRSTDADHYVYDGFGQSKHIEVDQKGDAPADENSPVEYECKSGWVSFGQYFCNSGKGGCYVVLDGTDDNQSDEANAMRFTLVDCSGVVDPPDPDPTQTCDYPGQGSHVSTVFAAEVSGTGWENAGAATGEEDGQEAFSPNVEDGEVLTASFGEMCDPDGEETIDKVRIAVKLRTQYESGKYDILLKFHAGGPAHLITHHTDSSWDELDITADLPGWSIGDVSAVLARLELHQHPQGNIDSDVWVDAFRLTVEYTTAALPSGQDVQPSADVVTGTDAGPQGPFEVVTQADGDGSDASGSPLPWDSWYETGSPEGCIPDSLRCRDNAIEVCVLGGTHFVHYQSCASDESCQEGTCVADSGSSGSGCASGAPGGALPLWFLMLALLALAGLQRLCR